MAKRKQIIDITLPVPSNVSLSSTVAPIDSSFTMTKQIIRQAIKASYSITDYNAEINYGLPNESVKQLVSDDKIDTVITLMQAIQPINAVEAALAVQFTATYIQGLRLLQAGHTRTAMPLLTFSQTTLDSINRFRNKGMQQINVQYNVNKGQVVNIKNQKVSSKQN